MVNSKAEAGKILDEPGASRGAVVKEKRMEAYRHTERLQKPNWKYPKWPNLPVEQKINNNITGL